MRWLTVDPGDMTGWQVWEDTEPVEGGQTPNWAFIDALDVALGQQPSPHEPQAQALQSIQRIVVEDFVLYPWAAKDLAWNDLMTARVIGAIMLLIRQHPEVDLVFQPAKIKETAVAGGAQELFVSPRHENRHQNDAIMHGVFYIQTELLHPDNARVENGRLVPRDA